MSVAPTVSFAELVDYVNRVDTAGAIKRDYLFLIKPADRAAFTALLPNLSLDVPQTIFAIDDIFIQFNAPNMKPVRAFIEKITADFTLFTSAKTFSTYRRIINDSFHRILVSEFLYGRNAFECSLRKHCGQNINGKTMRQHAYGIFRLLMQRESPTSFSLYYRLIEQIFSFFLSLGRKYGSKLALLPVWHTARPRKSRFKTFRITTVPHFHRGDFYVLLGELHILRLAAGQVVDKLITALPVYWRQLHDSNVDEHGAVHASGLHGTVVSVQDTLWSLLPRDRLSPPAESADLLLELRRLSQNQNDDAFPLSAQWPSHKMQQEEQLAYIIGCAKQFLGQTLTTKRLRLARTCLKGCFPDTWEDLSDCIDAPSPATGDTLPLSLSVQGGDRLMSLVSFASTPVPPLDLPPPRRVCDSSVILSARTIAQTIHDGLCALKEQRCLAEQVATMQPATQCNTYQ